MGEIASYLVETCFLVFQPNRKLLSKAQIMHKGNFLSKIGTSLQGLHLNMTALILRWLLILLSQDTDLCFCGYVLPLFNSFLFEDFHSRSLNICLNNRFSKMKNCITRKIWLFKNKLHSGTPKKFRNM